MNCVKFYGLILSLPEGWFDISDDLPPGSPPTLARLTQDAGVLQFSVALYHSGKRPRVSEEDLLHMLEDFQESRGLGLRTNVRQESAARPYLSADFVAPPNFIRAYYVSDGDNICLLTYLCALSNPGREIELDDVHHIVKSIAFDRSKVDPQTKSSRL